MRELPLRLAGAGGGLAGIELDVGRIMPEAVERAAGMLPGGDEDDAMGAGGPEEWNGKLRILLRAL